MKNIIAEIDKLAKHVDSFDEPWAFNIVWRLDRIAQQLSEKKEGMAISKISKNVLDQYIEDMSFLSENENKLAGLVREQETKNASAVYRVLKTHFGSLDKKDSINFIKNILKKQK